MYFSKTLFLERKTDDCRIYPKFFRSNFLSEKQLTLQNGSFLKARKRPFLHLVLNKMDITSYLISIDVNSTLYDEVNAPIQNSLECQHKNSLFLNVLSWTKTKSYTDRLILSTQLKSCCSKVAHKRTEYNNVLWPEIVVENWTGSSGHERHLPTGVGILSWELKARAYQLETTMHIQCASLAVHNITVTVVNSGEIHPKIQTEFLFKITARFDFQT